MVLAKPRNVRGPRGLSGSTTTGVSTMSDFNRNVTTTQYGTTVGQSVEVDAGLRAYMLRVYNYMVIGLAITGFAALGIYMLSVTGDMAAAAKVMRNGAEIPARIAANTYLTPLGYALFVSPLKWAVILAPLAMVFVLSFGQLRVQLSDALLGRALIALEVHECRVVRLTPRLRLFFLLRRRRGRRRGALAHARTTELAIGHLPFP